MVFYFESNVVQPPAKIFMGLDKHENEGLIRWGWPEDVWFHVDKESSAHVYLRLPAGQTLDDIPSQVIDDCAQLVKANSIKGNKMNNLKIVYCMWDNLKKTGDMAVGQVSFHNDKGRRYVTVEKRVNDIVNRLNKTKVEKLDVDLQKEKEDRDREEREDVKARVRLQKKAEEEEAQRKADDKELRSYDRVFDPQVMATNKNTVLDDDDFM